ncbi:MAG: peptidoglycan-binding protein [Clostridia bacterium]|nr:peptidoglycan-binding protein [Clostridia bacterium]
MGKKVLRTLKRAWKKLSAWNRETVVPWIKEKLVPWLKETGKIIKYTTKEWLSAIPPFLSKVVRGVESGLNRALLKLSRRTGQEEADPGAGADRQSQRVSRPLLFLVLGVMCVVIISVLILTIALGARFFSCVCRPSGRGTEPVGVTETASPSDDPEGEPHTEQNLPVPQTELVTPAPPVNPDDTYLGGETYEKGDTDETVAVVQQRLMDLGYMDPDEPTEHFGGITLAALESFQKRNNLPVNGIIDETTYALLFSESALEFVMQIGDTGDAVEEVQERLYELGYLDKESRTGTFGEKTEAAVIAFQTANKLDSDGLVGATTREALYAEDVVGNVFKSGDRDDAITPYQERLKELGYLEGSYDEGKMDKATVNAIKEFQDATGLVKDGVLGPTTMTELDAKDAPKYALRLGMSGSKVKDAQKQLKKLGYLTSSEVSGYFDDATEEAVKLFQRRNGLSADGAIGSKTLSKLYDDDAKHAPATATPRVTKKPTATPKAKKATATPKKGAKATPTPKKGTKATATPKTTKKATAKPKVTPTPKPASTASGKIENLIKIAQSKIGCPYVSGAKGPNRFDCSGFVYWCLNQAGVKQGYMTSIGWRKTSRYKRITSWGSFQRGDIMVFKGESSSTGHVGIYLGGGKMIDASSGAGQVRITSTILSGSYWKAHFLMAYRIWE